MVLIFDFGFDSGLEFDFRCEIGCYIGVGLGYHSDSGFEWPFLVDVDVDFGIHFDVDCLFDLVLILTLN